MPTILTKVIDTLHRHKDKFLEEYGKVGCYWLYHCGRISGHMELVWKLWLFFFLFRFFFVS